jgi:hypothetical protein
MAQSWLELEQGIDPNSRWHTWAAKDAQERAGAPLEPTTTDTHDLDPFNSNSPTGSTFTAFSTSINTRGLMSI